MEELTLTKVLYVSTRAMKGLEVRVRVRIKVRVRVRIRVKVKVRLPDALRTACQRAASSFDL